MSQNSEETTNPNQPQPQPPGNHLLIGAWAIPRFFSFLGITMAGRKPPAKAPLFPPVPQLCERLLQRTSQLSWHVLACLGSHAYIRWGTLWWLIRMLIYIHPCYISLFPMINHYWRSYYTITTSKYRDFLIYKTCILDYLREGFLGPPSHLNIRNCQFV